MNEQHPALNEETKKMFDEMKQMLNEPGNSEPGTTDTGTTSTGTTNTGTTKEQPSLPYTPTQPQPQPQQVPSPYSVPRQQTYPPRIGLLVWGGILIILGLVPLLRTVFPWVPAPSGAVFLLAGLGVVFILGAISSMKKHRN